MASNRQAGYERREASVATNASSARAAPDRVSLAIGMLRVNGFLITDIHLDDQVAAVKADHVDDFGIVQHYLIGVALRAATSAHLASWRQLARNEGATLVVVADEAPDDRDESAVRSWPSFSARLGGLVPSALALDLQYRDRLIALGHNERPSELTDGAASDLYEVHVAAGLEFLLGSRVIRYGTARRGEAVPDGMMLPIAERGAFLYDAKAAMPAYAVQRQTLRQFADYVRRYDDRYSQHVGRVRAFLVISSQFAHGARARRDQSQRLQGAAGVPLVFLTSATLADLVDRFRAQPWARNSVLWGEIFSGLDVTVGNVDSALTEVERDGVR